ncbi:cytochrome c1 [Pseudomarimonas salicorniae]|uniref:Cytochrome c1 n=1 Tax=Pseudomarimonas salicorniae TaxID=2933270 RepID=A0ABT0GDD9_9GAMM|nr:cytochrome c1 [Lysobacter sp. CAU 1642]MCK7592566.1 cytochrome c1 [Lysobacter sp. CAU 1642]
MTKRLAAFLLALLPGLAFAAGDVKLLESNASVNNIASLQRGAAMYMSYCSGCHALGFQRYSRIAKDLELPEELVMDKLVFTDAKIGDHVKVAMDPADGQAWFGKTPPDLSLVARSKPGGPDWVYTFLKSFYVDETRPAGWNNTVLPGSSMPHVLWELQGSQRPIYQEGAAEALPVIERLEMASPGSMSAQEYDAAIRDLTNFLTYVGEPAAIKRTSMGVWVILFLAAFTFLAWLLKHEYWRDVH